MNKKIQVPERLFRIILITSKHARSGKDTMADILYNIWKSDYKYNNSINIIMQRRRFAQEIIQSFESVFEYNWDVDKIKPEVRLQLINFAQYTKSADKFLWINKTIKKLNETINSFSSKSFSGYTKEVINIIFTDCRYQYEYDAIKKLLLEQEILESKYNFSKTLYDIKLVEVVSNSKELVNTDRDTPEDSIKQKPDVIIYNPKGSLEAYQKETQDNLGFIFK